MMLQGIIASSGDGGGASAQPPQQPPQPHESGGGGLELGGGGGSISEEERGRIEESDRSSGGNRWPRQETLALLKIRSDMDVAFRDSSLKGPLWDEVSRKLAELGYHRSAKKCKEKFENVYKYHKRTKEGRTSKADGKTYRFFDQLEALEANPGAGSHTPPLLSLPPPPPPPSAAAKPATMLNNTTNTQISLPQVTVPSVITQFGAGGTHQNNVNPISVAAPAAAMPAMSHLGGFSFANPNVSGSTNSNSNSSSTSSDDEPPKRKRKWKDFFGTLMKEVIGKQEELQMKFIETIEKRERDRMAREEAWRNQEMAKMKREHELLVQERSMAAAKDAAVINFLQKITEQNPNVISQIPPIPSLQQQKITHSPSPPPPPPPPPSQLPQQAVQEQQQKEYKKAAAPVIPAPVAVLPVSVPVPIPALPPALPPAPVVKNLNNGGSNGGGENMLSPSPSRWPKAEINALISLRTTLDMKYQENGPKGPLWEEISSAMKKLGYNRNAKRCKEKWENINKYYKKVKESSKKRPEDSKTCPYFHQLDAIYREKSSSSSTHNLGFSIKPETQMGPIMARPEQQWPLPAVVQEPQQRRSTANEATGMENRERENLEQNNEDDYDEDDDEDDDDDDEGGEYEIVPNKQSSMAAVE